MVSHSSTEPTAGSGRQRAGSPGVAATLPGVEAVVLVGGMGTRMRPLTLSAPKPMLPTAGVPLLTHLLARIRAAGVRHVVLGTSYRAEVFADFADQAAYLLGGLQLRGLRRQLVDTKVMTNRQFHDEILRQGNMPMALIRLNLTKQKLTRDMDINWKFYGELPEK